MMFVLRLEWGKRQGKCLDVLFFRGIAGMRFALRLERGRAPGEDQTS